MVGQFTEALKDTKEFIKASIEEMVDPFAMDSILRSVQQPAPNQWQHLTVKMLLQL